MEYIRTHIQAMSIRMNSYSHANGERISVCVCTNCIKCAGARKGAPQPVELIFNFGHSSNSLGLGFYMISVVPSNDRLGESMRQPMCISPMNLKGAQSVVTKKLCILHFEPESRLKSHFVGVQCLCTFRSHP